MAIVLIAGEPTLKDMGNSIRTLLQQSATKREPCAYALGCDVQIIRNKELMCVCVACV